MFCFSVMESPFCFANVDFVTIPATSFVDDLRPLRSVLSIFVRKIGFDAACVLEDDLSNDDLVTMISLHLTHSITGGEAAKK